jgi:glycosyltransferase involved in cell wall biosynthesis
MNILFAMPWDQRIGGVTHVASSLGHILEARGHRAMFLFPAEGGLRIKAHTSLRGFPALYCRLRNFPPERPTWRARVSWYSAAFTALPQLVPYGLLQHVDLINVHYPGDGFALMADLARWLRVPLVVSAHGSDLLPDAGPSRGNGLRRLLDSADAVVVPSHDYLRTVVDAFPSLGNKIRCIHNGYDEEELSVAASVNGSYSSDVTALCIAALIHKKGIDVLLQALAQCRSNRLKLRLVGDGPLREQLESLTAMLRLSDRVSFLGMKERDEVCRELAHCDLLVLPSRHPSESFGLAALEAMACGKAVVASALGGLPELVDDRETGLLVRPEDPTDLAAALDLLVDDAQLRLKLGAAGRSKATRFTARRAAEVYEGLFKELVARAARASAPVHHSDQA